MGNQVAKGRDNDELIKNLKESGHITSKKVLIKKNSSIFYLLVCLLITIA